MEPASSCAGALKADATRQDDAPAAIPFPRTIGEAWRQLTGDGAHAHPLVQFVKYALAGGMATAVYIATFFLAGWFLFPCLTQDDIVVRLLSRFTEVSVPGAPDMARAANAVYCTVAAYFLSNTVCYVLNRLFVFRGGRHGILVEILLFFGVSAISTFIGTGIQTFLIARFGIQTTIAFGANLVSALALNYALRKFVIFKG